MTAHLTRITAKRPATLSKSVRRGQDGALIRESGGPLVDGDARIETVASLAEFDTLLRSLTASQALTFGVPLDGDCRIVSRAAMAQTGPNDAVSTRTRDRFAWPRGPGILMLDHDPDETPLSRDALVGLVRDAAPGLRQAAMLWWPSASSHICDAATGEDLTGLRGQRLYLLVKDAGDIPRAGANLVDRLWAAGHGHIVVSRSGIALERCPIDAAVWQPERLDFAAGASCHDGLQQRRGNPEHIPGSPSPVDTRLALPDEPAISAAAASARQHAKSKIAATLDATRAGFLDSKSAEILSADDMKDPEKEAAAREIVRRAVDQNILTARFPIQVEMAPGHFETLTVDRILEQRISLHGRLTRDPLEPDYDNGRAVGKLFLLDTRPTLFSFARGERSFRLAPEAKRVEVPKGRVALATEATLRVLRSDPAVFDFGGQVALVESAAISILDEHALGFHLAGCIQFWQSRMVGGVRAATDIDPPAKVVRQILSLGSRRQLKSLTAIVTSPTIRPDGTVLVTPGYDVDTGLLVCTSDAANVPMAPTPREVRQALSALMHPFASFPLVDRFAFGALLAALLSAVIRPAIATCPAFAIDAPVQGSGKTLLASCVATLATGRSPEIWPHTAGRDDEETRKRLFAALRDGANALIWDNITGVFDSAALASAITAPLLRDRILGQSETRAIPNRALLLLTGNNLCPAGDLPRRIVPIRIDPGTDAPFARQFDLDPLDYVHTHRSDLACAALILIRGWLSSGRPRAAGRTASFEAWDDLVRQTVCWINDEIAPDRFGDPLELIRSAQGSDPEQECLFALLEALDDVFGNMWFTARETSLRASRGRADATADTREKALADALSDIGRDRALASTKSVGRILKFREGRIVFGMRLRSRSGRNGLEYRIEKIDEAGPCGSGGLDPGPAAPADVVGNMSGRRETNPPNPPNPQDADPTGVVYW